MRATLREGASAPDNLCCGGLGRADALLEIARRAGPPGLEDPAGRIVGRIVRMARARGSCRFVWGDRSTVSAPGLFGGLAGVGYALLRAAHPGELPCALLLD